MPSSSKEPPDHDGEQYQLTTKRAIEVFHPDWVKSEKAKCRFRKICEGVLIAICAVPLLLIITIYFCFAQHVITLRLARQMRTLIFRGQRWKLWQTGYCSWVELNLMLFTYEWKKVSLSARNDSARRVLDAIGQVRLSLKNEKDSDDLLKLMDEIKPQDSASFDSRDKTWFMSRCGRLMTEPSRVFFQNMILLQAGDYEVLRHFCYKGCVHLDDSLRRIGKFESSLVSYYIDHKDDCDRQIVSFRPTMLLLARKYVDNMIMFCNEHDLVPTAHLWAKVGNCIVHFQDQEPSDDCEVELKEEVRNFFSLVDQACSPVYAKYKELDELEKKRQAAIEMASPKMDVDSENGVAMLNRWPHLCREKLGRFNFRWDRCSLTIIDMNHRESDHSRVKFEDMSAPQQLDIIESLMAEYSKGFGNLILPLGIKSWQAAMKGDAAEFIKRETETWTDAHPTDSKEVKRFHNRFRRIIPDEKDLRAA